MERPPRMCWRSSIVSRALNKENTTNFRWSESTYRDVRKTYVHKQKAVALWRSELFTSCKTQKVFRCRKAALINKNYEKFSEVVWCHEYFTSLPLGYKLQSCGVTSGRPLLFFNICLVSDKRKLRVHSGWWSQSTLSSCSMKRSYSAVENTYNCFSWCFSDRSNCSHFFISSLSCVQSGEFAHRAARDKHSPAFTMEQFFSIFWQYTLVPLISLVFWGESLLNY